MGFIPRRRIIENLKTFEVFIEDTQNEYFIVQDIPDTFVQGRSAFKLFGSQFLKKNVPLKIEILDKNGNTLYIQPVKYGQGISPKLPFRYITVEVYPPPINVPGEAELVILGELDNTRVPFNIPSQFQGTYNVRYSRKVNVDTATIINTQPILFYKKPTVSATSTTIAQKKTDPPNNAYVTGSNLYGKVKAELRGKIFATGSAVNLLEDSDEGGKSDTPSGDIKTDTNLWKYKTGLYSKRAVLNRRGVTEERLSPEPPQMTIITTTAGSFNTKMVGGDIEVHGIDIPAAVKKEFSGLPLQTNAVINSKFTFPIYKARVENVISDTKLTTSKPYSIKYKFGPEFKAQGMYSDIGSPVAADNLYANFTASYVDWNVPTTSSYRFDTFIDIDVSNMRTFSGDVYRMKVYGASDSSQGDFPVLLDTIVESSELLVDKDIAVFPLRSGYLQSQGHIDKYWDAYGGNNASSTLQPQYTMSLADAVYLSGSYDEFNSVGRFELRKPYEFTVKKDIPYTLSFNAYGKKTLKTINPGGDQKNYGKLMVHLSGSNIAGDSRLNITHKTTFGQSLTNATNQKVGLELKDDDPDTIVEFPRVSHTFYPKFKLDKIKNDDTILQFRIEAGDWYISDISLRPAQDTGFSPDEMKLRVPIGVNTLRPDNFDLLIEYYDINGNTAEAITFVDNVGISGSALVVEGTDNLLTGSLFIGGIQGEGIEMAGANSAYMRSIGYEGFISASIGGQGGFMIWSGSVIPNAPDSYSGSGLEIHDGRTGDDESYFKFRTIDAENDYSSSFDVKSSRFFFGSVETGNYVSGALGNIEISSSNFHLQNDGDVIMQGTITAEAGGTIGGFSIGSDNLTATNFVLNTTNKALSLGSGNTIFIADADDGIQLGHATFGSAPFSVTPAGVLKATSGTIGGFTLSSDNLTATNFTLSPSGKSITLGSGTDIFIVDGDVGLQLGHGTFGSAPFSVTKAGVVKAESGTIAGWSLAEGSISKLTGGTYTGISSVGSVRFFAGADNLTSGTGSATFRVGANGAVTASSGVIGGWKLSPSPEELQSPNGRLTLSGRASHEKVTVKDSSDNIVVKIGEISSDTSDVYGIKVYDGSGASDDNIGTGTTVLLGGLGNKIGGWEITNKQIRTVPNSGMGGVYEEAETGLILHNDGRIETSDFATGLKGWRIDSRGNGTAEFENARIRGTLRTTVFEKESVNVVGGQLMIANSTTFEPLKDASGSIVAGKASASATDVTMSVANVSGFTKGEIIKTKKVDDTGFIVEYMQVTGSLRYSHPSSSVSASIAAANMGSVDPDGLAGELYVGRGHGQNHSTGSTIGKLGAAITDYGTTITSARTGREWRQSTLIVSGANNLNTGSYDETVIKIGDERMKVVSVSGSTVSGVPVISSINVVRDYHDTSGSLHSINTAVDKIDAESEFLFGLVSSPQTYNEGQVFVSTGVYQTEVTRSVPDDDYKQAITSGYILMNANPRDMGTPYMQIVERTGSGVYDLQLRAQLGDLSGLSAGYLYGESEPGFGLYTENGYFRGSLHALTGSIHGVLHVATTQGGIETGQKISIGRNVSGINDGLRINENNYWFTTSEFRLGDASNYLWISGSRNNPANSFKIKTDNISIDTSTFMLSSSLNNGTLRMGASKGPSSVSANTQGIYMDGAGDFQIYGDADNYLRFDVSDKLELKSENFELDTPGLDIVGTSGTAASNKITLGATANTSVDGTNIGIYMDGGGDFLIYGDANNFFRFDVSDKLEIRTENLDLFTSTIELTTSGSGRLSLGTSPPTSVGTDGIFLSGSGHFSIQSASNAFMRLDEDGFQMTFPSFSVSPDGFMSATDGIFKGNISATTGFIGSSTSSGWNIDGSTIGDINNIIQLDSSADSPNITITSGSFVAELVPDFTPASVILNAGGNTYSSTNLVNAGWNGSAFSFTNTNGDTDTTTLNAGGTSGVLELFGGFTGTGGGTASTHTTLGSITDATLSGGTKAYKSTATIRVSIAVNSPQHGNNSFISGTTTVGGNITLRASSDNSVVATQALSGGHLVDYEATAATTRVDRSYSVAFTHTVATDTTDYYFEIDDVTVRNNGITEAYTLAGTTKSFTNAVAITDVAALFLSMAHQPSNKKTEIAPAGIQSVYLAHATLEQADTVADGGNAFVRISPEEPKTFEVLGTSFITGSLIVREHDPANADQTTIGSDITTTGHIETSEYVKAATGLANGFRLGSSAEIVYDSGIKWSSGNLSTLDMLLTTAGALHTKDDVVAFSTTVSDKQFKKNVIPIQKGLSIVKQLQGVEFDWDKEYAEKGHDIGFIAQDVQKIKGLESVVKKHYNIRTDDEALTVSYEKITTVLVEAIKEQQKQIDELKKKLEEL